MGNMGEHFMSTTYFAGMESQSSTQERNMGPHLLRTNNIWYTYDIWRFMIYLWCETGNHYMPTAYLWNHWLPTMLEKIILISCEHPLIIISFGCWLWGGGRLKQSKICCQTRFCIDFSGRWFCIDFVGRWLIVCWRCTILIRGCRFSSNSDPGVFIHGSPQGN